MDRHHAFTDAQALVEYIAMVPCDVQDFRVDDHLQTLLRLDAERPVGVTQRRRWLDATRTAARPVA